MTGIAPAALKKESPKMLLTMHEVALEMRAAPSGH